MWAAYSGHGFALVMLCGCYDMGVSDQKLVFSDVVKGSL